MFANVAGIPRGAITRNGDLRRWLHEIAPGLVNDFRGHVFAFEEIVALFEVFPEMSPLVICAGFHPPGGHAEWEDVDVEKRWTIPQGGIAQRINFLNFFIGHCQAAGGDCAAVNHEERSGAVVITIEIVRKTDVEGEVEFAVRLHRGSADGIKTFGHLAIAFCQFGAEFSGSGGDFPSTKQLVLPGVPTLDPEFEFAFLFEGAKKDRISKMEVFRGERFFEIGAHACYRGFRS